MSLLHELKRRNVFRMVLLYAVGAWLILQVADVLLPALALPDWVIRLVAFLLIIGFPLVLAFSWVYELTPEGLKKESEVDREHSITHTTGRKINVLIIVLLVLAIGSVWLDRWLPGTDRQAADVTTAEIMQTGDETAQPVAESTGPTDNTIAVLPFVNMSADEDNEYFSDGLSEELLNLLTRIPELQVASRTSSFSFKGTDAKIEQIAADLNVAHVLEGSVRKSGDTVRITAQLIQADNGYHLWSETYDRRLDDIFAVQDEIAAEVVSALRLTLLNDAPSAAITSPEVYSLYLQAMYEGNQYTTEGLINAERLIEEAIALDSGYAPAWLELASTLMNQVAQRSREPELAYRKAREAAQRALELDPGNSAGYVSLAWIAMKYDLEFHEAAEYLGKARSMSPNNDDVTNGIATLQGDLGHNDEAIELYRGMIERDPLSIRTRYNLADTYWKAGRAAEARVEYDQLLGMRPTLKYAEMFQGRVELSLGNLDKALMHFENESDEAARLQGLVAAYHARGEESASRQARKELTEKYSASLPYEVARAIAYTGDANATFELLDRAFEQRSGALVYSKSEPFFEPVHDDPRWAAWLERLGMSDAQTADIEI